MPAPLQPHPDAAAPGSELPSHNPDCYGCGASHPAGLNLRIRVGDGLAVVATFVVADHHQGAPGLAHGGVLAAAFDEVLGALNWLLRVPAVTGRLETDFLQPVPVGATLTIQARIDAVTGRKVECGGVALLPDGSVAARARGLFVQVPAEHFRRHAGRSRPEVPGAAMEPAP